VGDFLRDYLDVDVEAVTKELKKKGVGARAEWMGRPLDAGVRTDGFDEYHGDFKHRH
jgi:alkaline phosphatase